VTDGWRHAAPTEATLRNAVTRVTNLIVVSENHIYRDFKVRTIIQRRRSSEVRARWLRLLYAFTTRAGVIYCTADTSFPERGSILLRGG